MLIIYYYICSPLKEKQNDSVAQLVEHYTFNVGVLGSNPSGITKSFEEIRSFFYAPKHKIKNGVLSLKYYFYNKISIIVFK